MNLQNMNLLFAASLILFLSFSSVDVHSGYVVKKNSLSILYPQNLVSEYDAAIENFWVSNDDHANGSSVVGALVYPQKGSKGCNPFDGDRLFKHNSSPPTVLLLDRGECYFALKVWNAQNAGAAAVLIADDIYEPLITVNSINSGFKNITIPSALIQKSLGETLKDALLNKGDNDVVIKLDWSQAKDNLSGTVI